METAIKREIVDPVDRDVIKLRHKHATTELRACDGVLCYKSGTGNLQGDGIGPPEFLSAYHPAIDEWQTEQHLQRGALHSLPGTLCREERSMCRCLAMRMTCIRSCRCLHQRVRGRRLQPVTWNLTQHWPLEGWHRTGIRRRSWQPSVARSLLGTPTLAISLACLVMGHSGELPGISVHTCITGEPLVQRDPSDCELAGSDLLSWGSSGEAIPPCDSRQWSSRRMSTMQLCLDLRLGSWGRGTWMHWIGRLFGSCENSSG